MKMMLAVLLLSTLAFTQAKAKQFTQNDCATALVLHRADKINYKKLEYGNLQEILSLVLSCLDYEKEAHPKEVTPEVEDFEKMGNASMQELAKREIDFIKRHHLDRQFVAEDKAGKR